MSSPAKQNRPRPPQYDSTVGIVAFLAVVTGTIATWHLYTDPEPIIPWGIEFVLGVIPAIILLYAAWWLTNHRPLDNDRDRLGQSALIGAIGIGTLAAVYAGQALIYGGFNGDLVLLVAASTAAGGIIGLTAALTQSSPRHVTFDTPIVDGDLVAEDTSESLLEMTSEDRQTIATVLTDPRLATLFTALAGDDSSPTTDDLVRKIARDTDLNALEARLGLHHVTLPKAEKAGLATVDPQTGQIVPGSRFDVIADAIGTHS